MPGEQGNLFENLATGRVSRTATDAEPYRRPPGQDSDTSREAADSARKRAIPIRRQIADFILGRGASGATGSEIAAWLAVPIQTVRARLRELELNGAVAMSRTRRMNLAWKRSQAVYFVPHLAPDSVRFRPVPPIRPRNPHRVEAMDETPITPLETEVLSVLFPRKARTYDEIRMELRRSVSTISGAMVRLKRKGMVEDSGRRVRTQFQAKAILFKLTGAARRWFEGKKKYHETRLRSGDVYGTERDSG